MFFKLNTLYNWKYMDHARNMGLNMHRNGEKKHRSTISVKAEHCSLDRS
jgi:hypothetical protein